MMASAVFTEVAVIVATPPELVCELLPDNFRLALSLLQLTAILLSGFWLASFTVAVQVTVSAPLASACDLLATTLLTVAVAASAIRSIDCVLLLPDMAAVIVVVCT